MAPSHSVPQAVDVEAVGANMEDKMAMRCVLSLSSYSSLNLYIHHLLFNHLTARLKKLIVTKLSLKIRVHDFVYITCILTAITPEPII